MKMKKMNGKLRWLMAAALVLMLLVLVPAAVRAEGTDLNAEEGALTGTTLDDLAGKTAGILTGTPQEQYVKGAIENPQLEYYNDFSDLALALKQGKVDYCLNSLVAFRMMRATYPEFAIIPEAIQELNVGIILTPTEEGRELQTEMNEYIYKLQGDGTMDELQAYWMYPNDWEAVDIPTSGPNGTIEFAAITAMKPYCFMIGQGYGGLDTAIIAGFCKEYGYGLSVENVDFSGALSGVSSGKYDIAAGQIVWTKERAESVLYTELYSALDLVPIVVGKNFDGTASDPTVKLNFFASLKKSFTRTLIEENRYQMILKGLGVTMIITVFGFLLANILGILLCFMTMKGRGFWRGLADIYCRIMQGTPIIVVLMILFYIIFKGRGVPGILVAVIGFGMIFAAYLAQLFEGAIRGVDPGQMEAALAIGFTPFRAFNSIVLPQAIRSMVPGYFSQLISLMKGTAVVGYIAVCDLTKAGDIIRSNTFEPFLPLITVAALYLLAAFILLSIAKGIQRALAPKRENRNVCENRKGGMEQ